MSQKENNLKDAIKETLIHKTIRNIKIVNVFEIKVLEHKPDIDESYIEQWNEVKVSANIRGEIIAEDITIINNYRIDYLSLSVQYDLPNDLFCTRLSDLTAISIYKL